jgi:hypothetical protein
MIQSWIIRQDMHPFESVSQQADEAICGQCPLRGGACYVDLRPVFNLYRIYASGKIPAYDTWVNELIRIFKMPLRLGAYGDPAATPLEAWQPLLQACPTQTGYTHQWRTCDPGWKDYLMASVESPQGAALAQEAGWRTYRITTPNEPLLAQEQYCPNHLDKSIQCDRCGLCSGITGKGKDNIANPVHGPNWKVQRFLRYREAQS